uniref:Uncharacterized protein n=1 Tax=Cacopsylla melanoneura TaxID=428564 RepID=A0A8D9BWE5_9HEMI
MPLSDEYRLTGSSDDWSARTDIPFLSLDTFQSATNNVHTTETNITDTLNIPTRAQTNETTPGFENNDYEFDENQDLCYISSIVEVLGDGMKRLADTIMKQYSKITSESVSNGPEENDTQENELVDSTASATQSNAATSTSALESILLNKDLQPETVEDSSATVEVKEKLSELEEISIRHSILLNNSYKSHWLLIRKVRTIQNDMKKIEKILLKIQSNQEKINLNANDIRSNLNVIKSSQQEIKINFDSIKSSQELIKKAQKNILQTQFLLSEKVRASISTNEMTTSTSENSSQHLDSAAISKPDLSFYTFNCALPNGMKLFDVSPDLLCRIINSKESFKSTLDYVYTQDLENSGSGNKPSLCGLLGVYECTSNIIDRSDDKVKSGKSFHYDSLEEEDKSNEESYLHSNQNIEEFKYSEVNLNKTNEDMANASETIAKEGVLLVQTTCSNEEDQTSEHCSDDNGYTSNTQAQDEEEMK